jgi:tryptophanyl-tRNA synthetase
LGFINCFSLRPQSFIEQQQITAWNVKGAVVNGVVQAIDYEKILVQFGSQLLTPRLIERFEKLTGRKAHHYMRRGIFYSHRDFDKILDLYEQGKKFYLYTGRGPSSKSLHAGHMIPFIFCQYLQEAFDVPIVIQMTDDEKFLVNNMTMQEGALCLKNNVKDIIACGFDLKKTFIFSNFRYYSGLLPNILKVNKRLTVNDSNKAFGFSELDCIGKFGFPAVQMVPCFSDSFPHIFGASSSVPCLIPCAIDQDVYFRLLRRVVAPQLKYKKPSLLHSKFFSCPSGSADKNEC